MRWPCLLLLIVALSAGTAQAQIFADKDARESAQRNGEKIEQITGLIRDLSEQNRQLRKQLTSISQQRQKLQQQVREISGKIEEIQQNSKRQQSDMKKALENPRIMKQITLLTKQLAELSATVADLQNFVPLPAEQDLYDAAYDNLQKQQHKQAIEEFNRLIKLYPQGQFGANSRYWISKAHFALKEYEKAKAEAETLMAEYPDNGRQAETILIIAEALRGLGMEEEARSRLLLLLEQFPTSVASDEARRLLAQ